MYTTPAPAKVNVYEPYAVAGLRSLSVKFSNLSCDPLSVPFKDCAQNAKLGRVNTNTLSLEILK
jgi:hypothetical protein